MSLPHETSSSPSRKMLLAYLLGAFGVIGFGATLPVTTIALEDFSPEFLTFARAAIAAGLAISLLLIFKKPLRHKDDPLIFLAGIFLIFTFPGFMAIAMQTVPAAYGGVVLGFLPLATAVIARLIAHEHPSLRFWILSIAGCLVVVGFVLAKAGSNPQTGGLAGFGWLILAGLTASLGYVIFGKLSKHTPGWEIISRSLLLNLPITLIGAFWFYDPAFSKPSNEGTISLIYLGSTSMFLAFCAWNVALAWGGIARIGQLQLLQVFVTIAIAAVLLGEPIETSTILAAVAITAIIAASRK